MGNCGSNPKPPKLNSYSPRDVPPLEPLSAADTPVSAAPKGERKPKFFRFSSTPSPARYFFSKNSPALGPPSEPWSATSTPRRAFKGSFRPPSPAKHIKAFLLRRHGRSVKHNGTPSNPEGVADAAAVSGVELDKSFGFSKLFAGKYEMGDEVGRGHFGYTCSAIAKKGELKGQCQSRMF